MNFRRFPSNPIITPEMDERLGANINGPSLIRVPEWLPNPLGRYYLYFAHHQGTYIRLACADELEGPWRIFTPGTLQLAQTACMEHIASPDVHVDDANRRIVMYFHGPVPGLSATAEVGWGANQRSFAATARDGIRFEAQREPLGPSYFRVFRYGGWTYALSMPGIFLRSRDGFTNFEEGPTLFNPNMRHAALRCVGDQLFVCYSAVGDCPEHIKLATIDLRPDWMEWKPTAPESMLLPETDYEGVDLPLQPSGRGAIHERARQLRDPGIYEEASSGGKRIYLLYSVAGESGIAIAEWQQ
jgi:hypothetical protein